VQPGSHLQPERPDAVLYLLCEADRACRRVKDGEEAVAQGLDLLAAVAPEPLAHDRIVGFRQGRPDLPWAQLPGRTGERREPWRALRGRASSKASTDTASSDIGQSPTIAERSATSNGLTAQGRLLLVNSGVRFVVNVLLPLRRGCRFAVAERQPSEHHPLALGMSRRGFELPVVRRSRPRRPLQ
jgi:hypothetical protein